VSLFFINKMFLPTSKDDLHKRNISQLDIILLTGDAYIDHPSFGTAIIGRYLEAFGYKVGIISQPDWKTDKDFLKLGRPRLFFGITAGNMDSMINHYTAQKKIRSEDAYSPKGETGLRPNRATLVYSQKVRALFKDIKIVLGGCSFCAIGKHQGKTISSRSIRSVEQEAHITINYSSSDVIRNCILFLQVFCNF